jgi:hypothetical protein
MRWNVKKMTKNEIDEYFKSFKLLFKKNRRKQMENLGTIPASKELTDVVVTRIQDALRNNSQLLPCKLAAKDLNSNFEIKVDATIHISVAGVNCDFDIHYPEVPQK